MKRASHRFALISITPESVPCRPVLPTHPKWAHALSRLEGSSPADEHRQPSDNTLQSLALLLFSTVSAENPFFLLAQSHQRCPMARGLPHPPCTPPVSPPEHRLCLPVAAGAAGTHCCSRTSCLRNKTFTQLRKEHFTLGARKRDSTEHGKLPRRGFSLGSKAPGQQIQQWGLISSSTAASPAASGSHLVSQS